ncbi:MAG: hypothetical protein IH808_04130 [Proteobacteria bacterium]|jgi:hypothetical protein|nr:hypothetical protein [Pseudomonadota bacterium]
MEPLQPQRLDRAISNRRMVSELIGKSARFLADYRLTNYVKPDQIDEISVDGVPCKAPAATFFRDNAELLLAIEGDDYDQPIDVALFDTFMVIEVAPRTLSTRYLVLIPNFENKSGSYVVGTTVGPLASASVIDTVSAIQQSNGQADLLAEAVDLLASLD